MKITAGINPTVNLKHLNEEEEEIVKRLSKEWYITNGGGKVQLNQKSGYKFFLMKPTSEFQTMFNLEREILVIFSSYENFEPRTLDAFSMVFKKYSNLRIDKVCTVLISRDASIEQKLVSLLKNDPESQIVVPFTYEELIRNRNEYLLKNRFKKHFYTRDLFAFEAPITKDLFFFGRNDLVHRIVNRHMSGENSALFGLRKTGKTSVVFGVKRAIEQIEELSVFIDCLNPSFHGKRWDKALFYIIQQIKEQNNLKIKTRAEERYIADKATDSFEKDILKINSNTGKKSILLIFDEIENLTPGISPSVHWTVETDFILLWGSIRTVFQKLLLLRESKVVFTFLIVGTNPMCVEIPTIHKSDNPIFNKVPFEYIQGFDISQTKEMVSGLGGYMGLNFDEIVYSKLEEDFGGHPFLVRHVCSIINEIAHSERPSRIDKTLYQRAKELFVERYSKYIEMIITVLKEFYNLEYDMLTYLAIDDVKTFKGLAEEYPDLTSHLLGYNVIDRSGDNYFFKIEAIKNYLANKNKYKKLNLTNEEIWREISDRRNIVEPKIRQIVKTQLNAILGKSEATTHVLNIYGDPRKSKYTGYQYSDLFDAAKVEIYLSDMIKIIIKHYDYFKNIFGVDKTDTNLKLETINKYRADAHSKQLTKDEIEFFRVCISSIENKINDFLN